MKISAMQALLLTLVLVLTACADSVLGPSFDKGKGEGETGSIRIVVCIPGHPANPIECTKPEPVKPERRTRSRD